MAFRRSAFCSAEIVPAILLVDVRAFDPDRLLADVDAAVEDHLARPDRLLRLEVELLNPDRALKLRISRQ